MATSGPIPRPRDLFGAVPFRRMSRTLKRFIPPINFITIHYTYFVFTILLSSAIFWATSTPAKSVGYVDSLFLVTSAMTLAGLNTINLSTLNTFQQALLCVLTLMGSAIFVSAFVVHFRRRVFKRKIESLLATRQTRAQSAPPAQSDEDGSPGGTEYQAICLLAWLVPAYFVAWQLFSCIGLGAWVAQHRASTTRENGMNPFWVGAFNAVSAFNNNGMSLLDANMVAFQDSYYMLITMGLLILAGNTCYPIFLRFIVWVLYKILPEKQFQRQRTTLKYLLDYPRRCYTNLFPSFHTWWLLLAVIVLNLTDWVAFEILNIGNKALKSEIPYKLWVIDGLFQGIAVRSGGFYVVTVTNLRISLLVLYTVMMYISVYPVVVTMRNSNVYEERSLGIYADDPPRYQDTEKSMAQSNWSDASAHLRTRKTQVAFVRQHIQAQISHDIWYLVLAVFLIMVVEGNQFEADPSLFSVFNVIFETVSAYGTVGISVGVPYDSYSFCGAWKPLSKLILCAVMLRGRHRGLPVAIDRAILLPGEGVTQGDQGNVSFSPDQQSLADPEVHG